MKCEGIHEGHEVTRGDLRSDPPYKSITGQALAIAFHLRSICEKRSNYSRFFLRILPAFSHT